MTNEWNKDEHQLQICIFEANEALQLLHVCDANDVAEQQQSLEASHQQQHEHEHDERFVRVFNPFIIRSSSSTDKTSLMPIIY